MRDRYLKVVLTVIALELGWIAINQSTSPVQAQANAAPMPVIIRGINIGTTNLLPVAVAGQLRELAPDVARQLQPVQVAVPEAVNVRTIAPVKIEADRPIQIEAGRAPLKVEITPYTPAQKPGE